MLDNIFDELKCRLFMSDVARFYGLEINRAGFTACPFHPDKTPSLKIYAEHYHCFGCGAHGDVTDFVARLFHNSQYDAAVKLNADFGLHLTNQKTVPMQQAVSPEVAYRNWLHSAERILNEYLNMLCRWQMEYAPKTPDEKLHPHFVESLTKMEQYRFLYEQIRFGSESEKRRLYLTEHETLRKLAERMKQLTAVKSAPKRKAI